MINRCQVRRQQHVVTFRMWGRKGYSVFQSLHKTIRIGCLGVGYLLFAFPANAEKNMLIVPHDSIKTAKSVEMEEVVVSAQRAPVTFSQVARILTVVEKDEIQKAPVQSIQDLLEYSAGIDLRQRGGLGIQSDITIRGSSFDQVLILLNGINISDPQSGHHNLNLPVSLDAVERIEILEGPASRIYGLNAFSGTINIITETSTNSSLKAKLSGGQFGYWDEGLSGNFSTGKFSNLISIDHRSSDGYIKNTDFQLTDAYYIGKLHLLKTKMELQAGHSSRAFGSNSFYTPVYPDQFENTGTTFSSIKAETGKILHLTSSIYWRKNQDCFKLFRYPDQIPTWYKSHNYHLTDVYGSSINGWFSSKIGKTAAGIEFRSENIWSTVLGKLSEIKKPIAGEKDLFYSYRDERKNLSVYFEHSLFFSDFALSGGLMTYRNSQLNRWNFYPGIDFSWIILKNDYDHQARLQFWKIKEIKLFSSFNKSLRMPTFTDLYYSSPTNEGNRDLKPEEATSFESGFKFKNQSMSGHLTYFHQTGNNLIDWVHAPGETIWKAQNLTRINTDGFEVSIKLKPFKNSFDKSFVKILHLSYCRIQQRKESGLFISRYVMDYLRDKAVLGFNHNLTKKAGMDWQISYQLRNGTYTKWEGSSYGKEVAYKPILLADAKLYWQKKNTFLYVELCNLLNLKYMDYSNVQQPGRWIKAGIQKQFEL